MSSLQIGRLLVGPPTKWNEQVGDPVTNLGGVVVPMVRTALRHAVSLPTLAADGATDTVAARLGIRRRLRSMLNNTDLKLQGYFYVQYSDDPDQNGWYIPDQGQFADGEGSSGLATGWWVLDNVNWAHVGHLRTNREARNVWLKDLRTGLSPRDTLKLILSTDFAALPAVATTVFPHGATRPINTLTAAVVTTSALPTGRDGGGCSLAVGLSDLACIAYDRAEAAMNLSDVVVYDRRGKTPGSSGVANYVPNPSFEHDTVGGAPAAWTNGGYTTFAVQSGWSSQGAKSLRMTSGPLANTVQDTASVATGLTNSGVTNSYPTTPGQTIALRADLNVLAITGVMSHYLQVNFFNSVGSFLSAQTIGPSGATGLVSKSGVVTAPAGAVACTVGLTTISGQTSSTIDLYMDGFMVVLGAAAVGAYVDGDTPGYYWTDSGTTASQLLPETGNTNFTPNPSFEYDTVGAAPAGWTVAGAPTVYQVQSGWSSRGTRSLRITSGALGGGAQNESFANGPVLIPSFGLPGWAITPGTQVAASVDYNVLSAAAGAYIEIEMWWLNASGTILSGSVVDATPLGIATRTAIFTAPPGTAYVAVSLTWGTIGASAGVDFYADSVMIAVGATAIPAYFDGDTSGYQWTGTKGNSVSTIDPQTFGWEEIYGPDYPWNWLTSGQPNDVPVLDNGLCRVRYDASVGRPGFRVDIWNGTAYVEQGKMLVFRIGDTSNYCDTFVSASLYLDNGYTPDRAVVAVVLANSGDVNSRERVFITMTRGVAGATFEIYPAPKANGTNAGALLAWTPASVSNAAPPAMSAIKLDSQTQPPPAGTGKITTILSGGGTFSFASIGGGSADFSTSENEVALTYCTANVRTIAAYQTNFAVAQAAAGAFGGIDTQAYGVSVGSIEFVYFFSSAAAGWLGLDIGFSPTVADQVMEAELMTLGANTTAGGAGDASNNAYTQSSRTTDANSHVTRPTWPNSQQGVYRVFARVKTTATQMSVYAKTGATTGTTRTVAGAATPTYTWVDLGDITANNTTLEIHAWVSSGAGIVEVDRIEAFLLTERVSPARYSGARDLGQTALYDARQRGVVVAR